MPIYSMINPDGEHEDVMCSIADMEVLKQEDGQWYLLQE